MSSQTQKNGKKRIMTTATVISTPNQLVSGTDLKEIGQAVLYGGIASGLLDATDGVIAFT
jgi:hypothetical protein